MDRLNRFGSGIAQLISGYPAAGTRLQVSPNPTPLQTALGIGTTLAGIYGDIGKQQLSKAKVLTIMRNRILKRPMFRLGGSAENEGIMDGEKEI